MAGWSLEVYSASSALVICIAHKMHIQLIKCTFFDIYFGNKKKQMTGSYNFKENVKSPTKHIFSTVFIGHVQCGPFLQNGNTKKCI